MATPGQGSSPEGRPRFGPIPMNSQPSAPWAGAVTEVHGGASDQSGFPGANEPFNFEREPCTPREWKLGIASASGIAR